MPRRVYQASFRKRTLAAQLLSPKDTPSLSAILGTRSTATSSKTSAVDYPMPGSIEPIAALFEKLASLVGRMFIGPKFFTYFHGSDRNRDLVRAVAELLGYDPDNGLGFADHLSRRKGPCLRNALLEIKLHQGTTVELGAIRPDSAAPLQARSILPTRLTYADLRYLVVGAEKAVDPPELYPKDMRTIDGVTWDYTPPVEIKGVPDFLQPYTTDDDYEEMVADQESKERAAMLTVTSLYLLTGREFFEFFPVMANG